MRQKPLLLATSYLLLIHMSHKTLDRQLQKFEGSQDAPPQDWKGFLAAISDTYSQYDDDRTLIERSLDISSQEHTEYAAKLKKSEQNLNSILNAMGDPLYVKNDQHQFIMINDQFCKFVDHTREELLNKSDFDIFPKDQAEIFWKRDEEILANGIENITEETLTDTHGRTSTIVTKKTRMTDLNGKSYIVAIIRDITSIKKVQEQLSIYEKAIEENPASIVITNPEGIIEYVNKKFCSVTGYTKAEAIGQNPRLLKSGETSPIVYETLWNTITSGNTWSGEFHNKKKNGELYWELATISPLLNQEKKIIHFIAIKEDNTEKKAAEETLINKTHELEELNQAMVGRELKMIELKATIAELKQKLTDQHS